jgi:FKBP-type peptidyl-prolyl cis-trans isomerase SlpA
VNNDMSKGQGVPVGPGTQVNLRFSLKLDNNEVIDSTGDQPATFTVGDGNLLPGFERAMFGMFAGESSQLFIESSQGFGPRNPDNIQMMKRSQFSDDLDLQEGLVVSFADNEQQELPGVIVRIKNELVEVDFNHPLAGKDILFEVEILTVEQITNDIVRAT